MVNARAASRAGLRNTSVVSFWKMWRRGVEENRAHKGEIRVREDHANRSLSIQTRIWPGTGR
jgi:hypothetical protein